MRHFLAVVVLLACVLTLSAKKAKVFKNPDYEYSSTAIFNVTEIERSSEATLLRAHLVFRPHWWIMIDSTASLVDPVNAVSYPIIDTEGLKIGEQFWMPESGEHDITLRFPPIPKDVKSVDYYQDSWKIAGLRLDGKKADKTPDVPVDKWLSENAKPYPGAPAEFFHQGECRIHGFMNGYNPACGSNNILFYISDLSTGGNRTEAIEINSDGSFDRKVNISNPGMHFLSYGPSGVFYKVYLEPGRDLAIYLDWEDILRFVYTSKLSNLAFGDQLGEINNELRDAPTLPYMVNTQNARTDDPLEIAAKYKATFNEVSPQLEAFIAENNVSAQSQKLMRNNLKGALISQLLDFDMYHNDHFGLSNDTVGVAPVHAEYYSFIEETLRENDPWFLANSDIASINNRIAFSDMPTVFGALEGYPVTLPEGNAARMLSEKGIELSNEEKEFADWLDRNAGKQTVMSQDELTKFRGNVTALYDKANDNNLSDEAEKWGLREALEAVHSEATTDIYNTTQRINAIKNHFGLSQTPLILQLATTAKTCNFDHVNFRDISPDNINSITQAFADSAIVDNAFILNSLKAYFYRGFASVKGYRLPDDERGRIMTDIIKPHEGKMLVIDMWATTCGPCRSYIKASRSKRKANLGHPDFKYIFLTGEEESPKEDYNIFVAEHLEGEECHRLPQSDYNRLRDLFHFNGIPRYILIDRDGTIIDDNYAPYNLDQDLSQRGITLNAPAEELD